MTYYAHFTSLKELNGISENKMIADRYGSLEVYNTEVPQELYEDYIILPDKYIAGEKEIEIDVPDFETVTEEYQEQVIDEEGNLVYDEEGNPVMETKTREVTRPVMIECEDTEVVIDYDEEGNPIGSHEITVIKTKQKTHKETITIPYPVKNPNYEEEQAEKERVRIANLHLTRGDVFRGLLLAKNVTRADIRGLIEAMPETTPQEKIDKEMALIDFDEALEFYRGVSLIDTLGAQLGISSEQMNRFFENGDYKELVSSDMVETNENV